MEILKTKPYAPFAMEVVNPNVTVCGSNVASHGFWKCAAKHVARSDFHLVGTCRMGRDLLAVVDPTLRVIGVRNLRVVDASVFPRPVNANTNAGVLAMAAKAAHGILRS